MSYLNEQIKEHCGRSSTAKHAHVYYYCYYGHDQDEAVPFLRWLIYQLCRQADIIPHHVYQIYMQGTEPSLAELLTALDDVLEHYETVFVLVDAVDESTARIDLLRIMRDLATDTRFTKIQLLASSREYIDIERAVESISRPISMANPSVEEDIRLYVASALKTDQGFRHWPSDLLKEAENAVSRGAKGM